MTSALTGQRIVVLGGMGFIGSHLVDRLVREGAEVLAASRSLLHLSNLASVRRACGVAVCDIRQPDQTRRLLKMFRPDIVVHLASHPDATETLAHMATCVEVNTLAVVHTLQAAQESGAQLFLYGDSCKVYGNGAVPYTESTAIKPACSYAVAKAAAWDLCVLASASTGIGVVCLRPTLIYGPRQNGNLITYVHACVMSGRPIRLQGGTQTRDPLFIDDAVEAFVAAASRREARGHALPIGGGSEISVGDLCRRVIRALGSTAEPTLDAEPPRPTEIWRSVSDNGEAAELLGWRPKVSLAEGLSRTLTAPAPTPIVAARDVRLAVGKPQPETFRFDAGAGDIFDVVERRMAPRPDSLLTGVKSTACTEVEIAMSAEWAS